VCSCSITIFTATGIYANTAVKVDYKQREIWSYHSADSNILRGSFALVIGEQTFRCSALPPLSRSSSPRGSALHRNVTIQLSSLRNIPEELDVPTQYMKPLLLKNNFGIQQRHFISQLRTQRKQWMFL